jgi:hypothetical protein
MYFAGISSSLEIVFEKWCRWGARSIMPELPCGKKWRIDTVLSRGNDEVIM